MTVSIFTPNKLQIGRLDVSDLADVPNAIRDFCQGRSTIPTYSYVVCENRSWTITSIAPFALIDGIHEKPFGLPEVAKVVYYVSLICSFTIATLALVSTVLIWLKKGIWLPRETEWALKRFPELANWLARPDDWVGLSKVIWVISWTPWSFSIGALLHILKEILVGDMLPFLLLMVSVPLICIYWITEYFGLSFF
jgi:hypothetical protein